MSGVILILVYLSAQRERFLWDSGCIQGLLRGCLSGFRGHYGVFMVYCVSETSQVELKSGRATFLLNVSASCGIAGAVCAV